MATQVLKFVDPNSTAGGTGNSNALTGADRAYVSLSVWEAANQADIVSADQYHIARCSSDDAGSTHVADGTNLAINGWTTDATRYIQIESASSHGGKWNAGIYRLEVSNDTPIYVLEEHVRIYGIQVSMDQTTTNFKYAFRWDPAAANGMVHVAKCIFKCSLSRTATNSCAIVDAANQTGSVIKAWNNIFYDFDNTNDVGILVNQAGLTVYAYNNTVVNCTTGMSRTAGVFTAVNNIVKGSGDTLAYVGTFTSSNYNATDGTDTGDGGANSVTGASFNFVNDTTGTAADFHIGAGSGAIDTGTPDPGSGLFSDDIDGVARTGTWDIGADEYVAAGGGLDFTHTGSISGAYTDAAGRTIEKFFTGDVSAAATWASTMSFESTLLNFIWTGGITGEAYLNAQRTIERVITGAFSGEYSYASQRSIEKMITGAVEGELTLAAQRTIEKVVLGDISGEYTVSHGRVVEKFFSGGIVGTFTAASGRTVEKFFTGNVAATGTWASTYSQTTGAWTLIVKPDTTWTLVAKPTGGAVADGFMVDGTTDGAYTRPHTDGFFAPDGTWTPVVQRWTTWTLINKPS